MVTPEGEKLHSDSGISVDSQSLQEQQQQAQADVSRSRTQEQIGERKEVTRYFLKFVNICMSVHQDWGTVR